MESRQLQQTLFQKINEDLPPHLSLAEELGELLGLSADSVYRRIRGEKPVTLDELKRICDHYRLSLDQLLQTQTDAVLFQAPGITADPTSISILSQRGNLTTSAKTFPSGISIFTPPWPPSRPSSG
jgi:hypothetical protein